MRRLHFWLLILGLFIVIPDSAIIAKEKSHKMNRLANEASPYLRQHADNPVDWYPWGNEALDRARAENKPIFLSIGYSTCHWCHVMERESFENEKIADIINTYFIAIKVDRESRPDLDETYMLATQILTRRGGWPNSVFLTPGGEPFYAGTYFPPDTFAKVLNAVAREWEANRPELEKSARRLASIIREYTSSAGKTAKLTPEVFARADEEIVKTHDSLQGGFSEAPKFPHEPILLYLLQRAAKGGKGKYLDAATVSLDAMARGGITDQVGGGFHRYSTDNAWLVPHFEKMLYNQAQLVRAYVQAYALTGRADFARTARRALDYVLADLRAPEGGFYSARDADSEGEEGLYYIWTPDQLTRALGESDAKLVSRLFGVTKTGNFEGANILHLEEGLAERASEENREPAEFIAKTDAMLARLNTERSRRKPPHRDEKIITAWNGMMVTAFAEAGDILDEKSYIAAAEKAATMLWQKMHKEDGGLWRVYFDGKLSVAGQQEDYAYLAQGLIALYDATGKTKWLDQAMKVTDAMIRRFADSKAGDFFLTEKAGMMGRPKLKNDGATASGNAVALEVLGKLSRRSQNPEYAIKARALLAALSGLLVSSPNGHAYALRAADALLYGEVGPAQYAGKGVLYARAVDAGKAIEVHIRVKKGWHINSNKPLEADFIATQLSASPPEGWKLGDVIYPDPVTRVLRFNDNPMALYEGRLVLKLPVLQRGKGKGGAKPALLKLQVQTCSDQICLEPETLNLYLPVS
ncbi:MAG TPA: DUF255 domain-containing protein [Rhizobiales bacterium]|nr:DUF255 domain-containing protein [Hyphomicrobiales bacterium]